MIITMMMVTMTTMCNYGDDDDNSKDSILD